VDNCRKSPKLWTSDLTTTSTQADCAGASKVSAQSHRHQRGGYTPTPHGPAWTRHCLAGRGGQGGCGRWLRAQAAANARVPPPTGLGMVGASLPTLPGKAIFPLPQQLARAKALDQVHQDSQNHAWNWKPTLLSPAPAVGGCAGVARPHGLHGRATARLRGLPGCAAWVRSARSPSTRTVDPPDWPPTILEAIC
jgi:hypothetical protein